MKLTVLVDMDDTIENLCEEWVDYLNEIHGTTVKHEDIKEWNMTKAFPTIPPKEVFAPLYEKTLWERVKPLPGAVEYLKKIIDDGHKVVIVTSSHPDTVALKLNNVLFKYFPYLSYNDVIITSQKQLIKGDILIDDAPHNLEGGDYFKLLFDAPHNQSYPVEENLMARVHNWEEVYYAINYLIKLEENFGDIKGDTMPDVILYSTGCPRCDVLKDKLESKGVVYKENNSVEEMTALGIDEVPILSIDGKLHNFKEAVEWVNNL